MILFLHASHKCQNIKLYLLKFLLPFNFYISYIFQFSVHSTKFYMPIFWCFIHLKNSPNDKWSKRRYLLFYKRSTFQSLFPRFAILNIYLSIFSPRTNTGSHTVHELIIIDKLHSTLTLIVSLETSHCIYSSFPQRACSKSNQTPKWKASTHGSKGKSNLSKKESPCKQDWGLMVKRFNQCLYKKKGWTLIFYVLKSLLDYN